MSDVTGLKLSICIATLNRAALLGDTLESLISEATDAYEIVILDGASTDDSEKVVERYAQRFEHLRYVRQDCANGIDRDYDRAVELARGEYCWVKSDDDPLKPGALVAVLEALREQPSLVVVNAELRDPTLSKVIARRFLQFESNRSYSTEEFDRLFVEIGPLTAYIGACIIKRSIWLARERKQYYGSLHLPFAVIFQERLPGATVFIATTYIIIRYDNARWWSKWFEILNFELPALARSLAPSESAKMHIFGGLEPWRNVKSLLIYRAHGLYSLREYRRLIRPRLPSRSSALTPLFVALTPGVLVFLFVTMYCLISGIEQRNAIFQDLRKSRYNPLNWIEFPRKSQRQTRWP